MDEVGEEGDGTIVALVQLQVTVRITTGLNAGVLGSITSKLPIAGQYWQARLKGVSERVRDFRRCRGEYRGESGSISRLLTIELVHEFLYTGFNVLQCRETQETTHQLYRRELDWISIGTQRGRRSKGGKTVIGLRNQTTEQELQSIHVNTSSKH